MIDGFQFHTTFFRTYAAAQKWERNTTLVELADRIRKTSAASKADLPWLKLAAFGDKQTSKGSLRHDANVKWCSGVEGDCDSGTMAIDEALDLAERAGLMCCIYTSPSHTEDKPKFRVLAPFVTGVTPDKRSHMMGRLNGLFRGVFARESWTLSQSYYFGAVAGNPSHRVEVLDGWCIDQIEELDEIWIGPPEGSGSNDADLASISAETREDADLIRAAITGEGYHVQLCALAARYIGRGIPAKTAAAILQAVMLSHPEASRDDRWRDRFDSIDELVSSAATKYGGAIVNARKAIAAESHRLLRNHVRPDVALAALKAVATDRGVDWPVAERIAVAIFAEAANA